MEWRRSLEGVASTERSTRLAAAIEVTCQRSVQHVRHHRIRHTPDGDQGTTAAGSRVPYW